MGFFGNFPACSLMLACLLAASAIAPVVHSQTSELVPDGSIFYKPPSVQKLPLYYFPEYVFSLPACGPRDDLFNFEVKTVKEGRNIGVVVVYSWWPNDYSSETQKSIVNGITNIELGLNTGLLRVTSWGVLIQINLNSFLSNDPYQKQYKGAVDPTNPFFWNVVDKLKTTTGFQTKDVAKTALHLLGRTAAKFGEGKDVKYPCREKKTVPGSTRLKNLSAYLHALKALVA